LHGDWTLLGPFRAELAGRARLVETTYPREPAWSLDDYARTLETVLVEKGITRAWLIAESFSSQVAWHLLARVRKGSAKTPWEATGLILVGGFIRHPWPWSVKLAHSASGPVPIWLLGPLCRLYAGAARRRFCHCPESVAELDEFVRRRANGPDRHAITSRYRLIAENDPGSDAEQTRLPVFQLSGAWDPIVPWWKVEPWLRRHCPGYRATRIIWRAGHNVLLSAPAESANQIMTWLGAR
jgi:pimeloyl-ACP methyl ester carboxylesterase